MSYYRNPCKKYQLYLIQKLLGPQKRGSFLDVGCGIGMITALVTKMGFQGQGIDPSYQSLATARKLHPHIQDCFSQNDLFQLQDKKKYGLVLMVDVLEHLKKDDHALRVANRLLKPRGLFLLAVPAHQKAWTVRDDFGGHLRRYEKKDLIKKLQKAGFKLKKFYSYGFPLFDPVVRMVLRFAIITKLYNEEYLPKTTAERTLDSGQQYFLKTKYNISNMFFNPLLIRPMFWFQNYFLATDRGENYIILAQKK